MSFTYGSDSFVKTLMVDPELKELFSAQADIKQMLRFEVALANAQASCGMITQEDASQIAQHVERFTPNDDDLRDGFERDGILPPSLLKQFKAGLPESVLPSFHLGTTSQDLVDSSLMIRLAKAVDLLAGRISFLVDKLNQMSSEASGANTLNARTRMQIAYPISVSQKLESWLSILTGLTGSKPTYFPLQLGGPDGTATALKEHYQALVKSMSDELELDPRDYHWQTDRKPLSDIVHWIGAVASGLGKIAQDVVIMAQSEVREIKLQGAGGSSSMAHKQNPVAAEVIVAQARFCQAQVSGLLFASIHENERSGVAMTLEWMLLPKLVLCCGSMTNRSLDLFEKLSFPDQ